MKILSPSTTKFNLSLLFPFAIRRHDIFRVYDVTVQVVHVQNACVLPYTLCYVDISAEGCTSRSVTDPSTGLCLTCLTNSLPIENCHTNRLLCSAHNSVLSALWPILMTTRRK